MPYKGFTGNFSRSEQRHEKLKPLMEAIIDSITKETRTAINHLNEVGTGGGNFRSRACAELAIRGGDKKAELQQ
ncbi:cytochrome P450 71A1, partial [Corchorus olitorius]